MKRVCLLAISDIIADQRVIRSSLSLERAGYEVVTIGRKLKNTPQSNSLPFRVKLFSLPFRKGILFYASYNIRAFIYLLFTRFDLAIANDLDTLLATRLACSIKRKPIIYDSHELFADVPELIGRNTKRYIWLKLEAILVKGLKHCITVSEGVANVLFKRYGVRFDVIRNLPNTKKGSNHLYGKSEENRERTIIYQGALNVGRGLEKLIMSMKIVRNTQLIIAGTGDIENSLHQLTSELNLGDTVTFLGRVLPEKLHEITQTANLGVSLEEDLGLSYHFALPNKIFDYIQAGIPVLASDLPEMKNIIEGYDLGRTISSNSNANELAKTIEEMLDDQPGIKRWRNNASVAAKELCWEKEERKLLNIVEKALII